MKRARPFFILAAIAVSVAGCGGPKALVPGGDEVGNGGDPLPKRFETGQSRAVRMVRAVPSLLPADVDAASPERRAAVIAWYETNHDRLDDDIAATPVVWVRKNANGACGQTGDTPSARVALSYDDCGSVKTARDAATHFIGEGVHHFGVSDDAFTAAVANAVTRAWRRAVGALVPGSSITKLLFEQGRWYAAELVARVTAEHSAAMLDGALGEADGKWLRGRAKALAKDIQSVEHEWDDDELPGEVCGFHSCLRTEPRPGAAVELSFTGCATKLETKERAAYLLLHLSLHHFLESESRAESLTGKLYALWQKLGHTEGPHWLGITELPGAPVFAEATRVAWTGSELAVWNREGSIGFFSPREDTWRIVRPRNNFTNAFSDPNLSDADAGVWAGGQLVVPTSCWEQRRNDHAAGHRYDPASREWKPISARLAPRGRFASPLAWRGKVILWGGTYCGLPGLAASDGGIYDPRTDTWEPIPEPESDEPTFARGVTLVGDRLVAWGGERYDADAGRSVVRDGLVYDLIARAWSRLPTAGAPRGRRDPVLLAAGEELIVFGGREGEFATRPLATGGRYDFTAGKWRPMADGPVLGDVPGDVQAAWTGTVALFRGSQIAMYHPVTDKWTVPERLLNPQLFGTEEIVWTGAEWLLWGGPAGHETGYAFFP